MHMITIIPANAIIEGIWMFGGAAYFATIQREGSKCDLIYCTKYFPCSCGKVQDSEKIHSEIPLEQDHRSDSKNGSKCLKSEKRER